MQWCAAIGIFAKSQLRIGRKHSPDPIRAALPAASKNDAGWSGAAPAACVALRLRAPICLAPILISIGRPLAISRFQIDVVFAISIQPSRAVFEIPAHRRGRLAGRYPFPAFTQTSPALSRGGTYHTDLRPVRRCSPGSADTAVVADPP
jgi:hypothetical protein